MEAKVRTDISLAHLTLNKELSDVTFKVGTSSGDTWLFPAHKFLLSEASPVFKAMFSGEYSESKSEVVITDISPRIFYKLLLFAYKVEFSLPSLFDVIDIVMAADKYQMDKLKSVCVQKFQNYKISWENFWDFLMNFYQFCDHVIPLKLKMDVILFLDANAAAILKSDNFLFVKREIVLMIISRDTLDVSELVVCEALLRWSKMQCCKENLEPSDQNKRRVLKDVIYMIRLSTLQRRDVLKSGIYELLTDEEKDAVMKECISLPKPWNSRARSSDTAERLLSQKSLMQGIQFENPLYLVFAKDAYLHGLKIIPAILRKAVTLITFTAVNDIVLDELKFNFSQSTCTYVKAFACYRLDINQGQVLKYDNWSYYDEKAVLFSIEDRHVTDLKKFFSSDYWKKVFARDPPVHDDGVISSTAMYSWGLEIKATFC